jgi:alkanesulfonate monooxygenase SsuD/methylene tetrahydromethanopterin reductase-like flavin-dependent oxidoreductase (luciferase family)
LNIVVGWNEDEFEMFGVKQREHDRRYEYGQEWIDAIKTIWSDAEDFDFDREYIKLKTVRGKPKPYDGSRPIIMNAGASPAGNAFAIRNCDAFFTQVSRDSVEESTKIVQNAKAQAKQVGRELDVYGVGVITLKPTQKEAEEYYRHCVFEQADWSAVDRILAKKNISPETVGAEEHQRQRNGFAQGMGGLAIVGDSDRVAEILINLSRAGLRGIGVSFVNYLDELPYFLDEVVPRLERAGIREKR